MRLSKKAVIEATKRTGGLFYEEEPLSGDINIIRAMNEDLMAYYVSGNPGTIRIFNLDSVEAVRLVEQFLLNLCSVREGGIA